MQKLRWQVSTTIAAVNGTNPRKYFPLLLDVAHKASWKYERTLLVSDFTACPPSLRMAGFACDWNRPNTVLTQVPWNGLGVVLYTCRNVRADYEIAVIDSASSAVGALGIVENEVRVSLLQCGVAHPVRIGDEINNVTGGIEVTGPDSLRSGR